MELWPVVISGAGLIASWWAYDRVTKKAPGPTTLPVIGNLGYFLDLAQFPETCKNLSKKYGDVVEVWLNGERHFIIGGEHFKYLMTSPKHIQRFGNEEGLRVLSMYENGIVMNNAIPSWHIQKRILKAALSNNGFMKKIYQVTNKKTEELVGILEKKSRTGEAVNLHNLLQHTIMDIIGEVAFSENFGSLSEDSHKMHPFAIAIKQFFEAWTFFSMNPPLVWKYLQKGVASNHKASLDSLERLALDLIKARKAYNQKNPIGESDVNDFLNLLLCARDEENPKKTLSDSEIVQDIREMLVGGTDTTANTISYTIYWIAKYPEVEQKLVKEIETTFPTSGRATIEHTTKLEYMDDVIQESARLSPLGPIVFRKANEEDTIGGVYIPKGTNLIALTNGHDERFFKNPTVFDPSRWSQDPELKKNHLPFGGGPRVCPGKSVANHEMKIVLGYLLKEFKFKVVKELKQVWNVVMEPVDGLWFTVEKRNK